MARFCTNCGQQIEENMNNCPNCGHQLKGNNANTNYNTQNIKSNVNATNLKSRSCAGVLGILLGSFGVHNFYLGYTGKAVTQLLLTILSCGILSIVSAIWSLVEGILILTGSINVDGAGKPLGL